MTTYGYGRVSTGQQTHDAQRDALTAQGIPAARIYLEKAGGARADRPRLNELLAQVRPGDEIITTRLDRFGRSVLQIITTVADLNARDIHVRTLSDGVDSRTPTGRMIMHVLAALAEYELQLIHERTSAARAARQRRDPTHTGGRPRRLTPQQLAAARTMHDSGQSLRQISQALSLPRSTVHDALSRARTPLPPLPPLPPAPEPAPPHPAPPAAAC